MRMYSNETVFDAALERTRWVFKEFPNVVVNISGGKDSTVVLNLAMRVAEELGRLPLTVMFIDQEAEWQCVIDYVTTIMTDPRVKPYWLQVPIQLYNATSQSEPWLWCWEEGADWIREKSPISIHENRWGTTRFAPLFSKFLDVEFPDKPACLIGGVRTEESPHRRMGLTSYTNYKWVTWGKKNNARLNHYSFYPIYDWHYGDVWKAIHENGWKYCPLYDYMYQYGIRVNEMRVSNVHHETAIKSLFFLQEIEPDNWNRITARLHGINTAGHLQEAEFLASDLPPMFRDWLEYRDYLVENLIQREEWRIIFRKQFSEMDANWHKGWYPVKLDVMMKTMIGAVLANDYHGTKMRNFVKAYRNHVGRRIQKPIRKDTDVPNHA